MNKTKNSPPLNVEKAFLDHAAWLVRAVSRKVRASHMLVEDACSFAWEQAFIHRDQLEAEPAHRLRAWLLLVATRKGWNMTKWETTGGVKDAAETIAATTTASGDEDTLVDRIDLVEFVESLTDHQRAIVLLYSFGFSYEQIAAALDVSYLSVNKALVKVKNKGRGR